MFGMIQRVALAALGAVVGLIIVCAMWLTYDVNLKRQQVRQQVTWLMLVSEARDEALKERQPPDSWEEAEPAIYSRFRDNLSMVDALDDLDDAYRAGDFLLARSILGSLESSIRYENATLSRSLGQRWDQATFLLAVSVAFSVVVFGLLVVRQREAWGRRQAEYALQATHARLMRLGVGIVGVHGDEVKLANDVIQRYSRRCDTAQEWWDALLESGQMPDTQPCPDCGEPVRIGRMPTTYESPEDGVMLYELSFGGHVHEGSADPYEVVLVRDVTHVRREEVRAQVEQRLSSVDDVASGVAEQFRVPLHGVAVTLRTARDEPEAPSWVDETLASVERLEELVAGLSLLQKPTQASRVDVADLCAAAARLAVPLTQGEVVLQVDVVDDVAVEVPPGRLTQLLYDLVADAVEACRRDGGRRQVTLRAYRHDEEVVVEVLDNRSSERIVDPAIRCIATEQADAMGLTIRASSRPHRTVLSLALPLAA
jgi:hypothetical protein